MTSVNNDKTKSQFACTVHKWIEIYEKKNEDKSLELIFEDSKGRRRDDVLQKIIQTCETATGNGRPTTVVKGEFNGQ